MWTSVCGQVCVLGIVDHKVDTRDCACFMVRDHKPGYRMPGAYFEQLGGQWPFQNSQHARPGLLFTAEGGLMSHEGLFELTLLYFRCQMGSICHKGT